MKPRARWMSGETLLRRLGLPTGAALPDEDVPLADTLGHETDRSHTPPDNQRRLCRAPNLSRYRVVGDDNYAAAIGLGHFPTTLKSPVVLCWYVGVTGRLDLRYQLMILQCF